MLTIVLGPNGSGKSLYGMHQLVRILTTTNRMIVTTLAVNLSLLNEYLQKIGKPADVLNRVLVIDKAQLKTFWRYRGVLPDGEYGMAPVVAGKFGDESWSSVPHGIFYILDEIQVAFGAREWTSTGPEFVAYQSQHRKLGDDVMAISPASSLIEKQFRVLSHETIALSNQYNVKVGIFTAPKKIIYKIYSNCPPVPNEPSLGGGNIYIDATGLAACYNTAAGLGIVGSTADKGRSVKGVPWWTIIPGALVAAVVVYFGLSYAMGFVVKRGMDKLRVSEVAAMSPQPAPTLTNGVPAAVFPSGFDQVAAAPAPAVVKEEEPLKYYSWCRASSRVPGGAEKVTYYVETEIGMVSGKTWREVGVRGYLDELTFVKASRPKVDERSAAALAMAYGK